MDDRLKGLGLATYTSFTIDRVWNQSRRGEGLDLVDVSVMIEQLLSEIETRNNIIAKSVAMVADLERDLREAAEREDELQKEISRLTNEIDAAADAAHEILNLFKD